MDSGAWRVGADLFKHDYNISIDVSFWQDQKDRKRYGKQNNHRNLSLVTWQQGGTDPSFGWGRTSVFPWGQGSKFDNTEAQKTQKQDLLHNGLIIILQDVGQIWTFVNHKLKGLYTKVAEEVYYLMKSKTLRESV